MSLCSFVLTTSSIPVVLQHEHRTSRRLSTPKDVDADTRVLSMLGIGGIMFSFGIHMRLRKRPQSARYGRCGRLVTTRQQSLKTTMHPVAKESGLVASVSTDFGPSQFRPPKRRRHPPYFPESPGCGENYAFMFLKPHANTPQAIERVKEMLASHNIKVCDEGSMDAETMDKKRIIDRHYGGLAEKALDIHPADLFVTPEAQDKFHEAFGLLWKDALAKGLICNAGQAMERLHCNEEELDELWDPLQFGVGKVKFAGGFYCGKIKDIYVINGFYMGMRAMFTKPGRSITYFAVKWDAAKLSWERFREKLIGSTDPAKANPESIRGNFFGNWTDLGLPNELSTGQNAVHASASSLEALVERMNWLDIDIDEDPFGRALLQQKISDQTIKDWTRDPLVGHGSTRRSLFDLVENMDHKECLECLAELFVHQSEKKNASKTA